MRDAIIERILERMADDHDIFFLSADMGAPALDVLRERYPDRFINVGIAEQNLVNVAAGLAMEGCTVYTLAIAPFYLRAFEQIRNNLSIPTRFNPLNVNMLGVGGGISYDLAGPSHHALEDLAVLRSLPDVAVLSIADWTAAAGLPDFARDARYPKYVRLDGKPHEPVIGNPDIPWTTGFRSLYRGHRVALIATGYMTRKCAGIVADLRDDTVGLVDIFQLTRDLDDGALASALGEYDRLVTLQEGYLSRGGLDTIIDVVCRQHGLSSPVTHLGLPFAHRFGHGSREYLHERCGMGIRDIRNILRDA